MSISAVQRSNDIIELEPELFYSTSSCTGGNTILINLCKEKDVFIPISRRTSSTTKDTSTEGAYSLTDDDYFNLSDVSEFILD